MPVDKNLLDDQITKLIGTNIRIKRLARGMSQEILGEICEIHRTYRGVIERDEKHIAVATLNRIAAALEEPLESFVRTNN